MPESTAVQHQPRVRLDTCHSLGILPDRYTGAQARQKFTPSHSPVTRPTETNSRYRARKVFHHRQSSGGTHGNMILVFETGGRGLVTAAGFWFHVRFDLRCCGIVHSVGPDTTTALC